MHACSCVRMPLWRPHSIGAVLSVQTVTLVRCWERWRTIRPTVEALLVKLTLHSILALTTSYVLDPRPNQDKRARLGWFARCPALTAGGAASARSAAAAVSASTGGIVGATAGMATAVTAVVTCPFPR